MPDGALGVVLAIRIESKPAPDEIKEVHQRNQLGKSVQLAREWTTSSSREKGPIHTPSFSLLRVFIFIGLGINNERLGELNTMGNSIPVLLSALTTIVQSTFVSKQLAACALVPDTGNVLLALL